LKKQFLDLIENLLSIITGIGIYACKMKKYQKEKDIFNVSFSFIFIIINVTLQRNKKQGIEICPVSCF